MGVSDILRPVGLVLFLSCMVQAFLVQGTSEIHQPAIDDLKDSYVGQEFVFGLIGILNGSDRSGFVTYLEIGAKEGGHFYVNYMSMGRMKNESHYIIPDGHTTVQLDIYPRDGSFQGYNAVKITSNTDISVLVVTGIPYVQQMVTYVMYPVYSSESKQFMATAYAPDNISPTDTYTSRVMVIGVNRRTTEVKVKDGLKTLVTHLNEMDVFQYDAPDHRDLTGCVITSDKDVLVLSGTSLSSLPSKSSKSFPLVSQMLPTKAYRYIVPPTEPSEPLFVKVLAEQPCNVTIINETSAITYTTKGGPQMYELGTEPASVLTSLPVTLVQYNSPFMTVVPGVNQYLNQYPFVVPTTIGIEESSLVAIVPSDAASGLLLDGAPFNGTVKHIASVDGQYTVLTGNVSPGFHYMVNKDMSVKFGLLVYRTQSYGFFVGMKVYAPIYVH